MAKKIEMINVISEYKDDVTNKIIKKKKVCAYARVSTDESDQLNSYKNQIDEFTKRINSNPEWEFAGMFSDEGISGTNLRKRAGFNQMIESARCGHIDLILTKSISRFGRNTVDVLSTINEMRNLNVEIYFEKENLYSSDRKVDFLLTIMSSIAQEESRNISENIRWSVRKKFKEGKVIVGNILGYDKDENGNLIINDEEAKTVKLIFNLYLQGYSYKDTIEILNKEKHRKANSDLKWVVADIKRILRNEKYCGDAILQKNIVIDYLTHKSVKNDNIAPKYHVHDNHDAIIPKETFELVQKLLDHNEVLYSSKRQTLSKSYSKYPLTGLVYCSICKRPMKRHLWTNGKLYNKIVLDCNHAPKIKQERCPAKTIENDILESAGIDAIKELLKSENSYKDLLIKLIESNIVEKDYISEITEAKGEINEINKSIKELIELKVKSTRLSDDEFNNLYLKKKDELDKLKLKIKDIELDQVNNHKAKEKLTSIKDYIESDNSEVVSSLFKDIFSLIIAKTRDDVVFIIDLKTPVDALINNIDEELQKDCIISKTHFDSKLRKNIRYEVILNEGN